MQTSINTWKVNPATNFEWSEIYYDHVPCEQPFMRKRVVGDWRNHFTPEQNFKFDAIYAERLWTGLWFQIPD